jgi:hypothetical protein
MKISLESLVFLLSSKVKDRLYIRRAERSTKYIVISDIQNIKFSTRSDLGLNDCLYNLEKNEVSGLTKEWLEYVEEFLDTGLSIEEYFKEKKKVASFEVPW